MKDRVIRLQNWTEQIEQLFNHPDAKTFYLVLVVLAATLGGGQYFNVLQGFRYFVVFFILLTGYSLVRGFTVFKAGFPRPKPLTVLAVPLTVGLVSWLINQNEIIMIVTALVAGVIVLVWSGYEKPGTIREGLYLAAWVWLFCGLAMWLARWENRNLIGFWGMLFTLVVLDRGKKWYYAVPFVALTIFTSSRGALIALLVALAVYYRPKLDWKKIAGLVLVGLLLLTALVLFFRTKAAFSRFDYWGASMKAWAASEQPAWGLGPGGLLEGKHIYDVEQTLMHYRTAGNKRIFAPHAHNIFFQTLAEFGAVGLLALSLAGGFIFWQRKQIAWQPWQAAILAGACVHCLVDLPIWYLGPMIGVAAVAGSVEWRRAK